MMTPFKTGKVTRASRPEGGAVVAPPSREVRFAHRPRAGVAAVLLLCLVGCTPYPKKGLAPIAVAGKDRSLSGSSVEVTLDGSKSSDPDGTVVAYEWRYTGWPEDFVPEAVDGGVLPTDPTTDPLAQPPAFCSDKEIRAGEPVQIRYCLIAEKAKTTVTLTPGGYRFTLWVTDNSGMVSADTVEITVDP